MIFENKKINAAIFDMDGTLFDTERLRMDMLREASEKIFGIPMDNRLLVDSFGLSADSAEALAKKHYGRDYPYKDIRKKADELELAYVRKNGVPVKKGVYDVLERFKKNGIFIALATSSKRVIAEEYLLNSYTMRYFDIIICGDEVENGKPDPEIFIKASKELICEPENCLIFEDSENGLIAASGSGANPVFIKDIKEPRKDIKDLAYKAYDSMLDFLEDLIRHTPKMPMPKINESFPQRKNHIKVGIHGFGAIGGGYLTQIFSHWDGYTRPAEIVGATNDSTVLELVNSYGKFTVRYSSIAFDQTIHNVRLISINDKEEMYKMYSESDIIGLSLPEAAIKNQSKVIAAGLIERYKITNNSLTILIILNKIQGGAFVKDNIQKELKKIAGEETSKEIISRTYFCETVVNRMVTKIPKEILIKQVKIHMKNFERDIVKRGVDINCILGFSTNRINNKSEDKSNVYKHDKEDSVIRIKGISKKLYNISEFTSNSTNLKVILFNSEPDIPLYSGKANSVLERLRQVETVDDIKKIQILKNKLSNGTHAIVAWYSSLLGYSTIGQGIGDPRVLKLAKTVMENEIKPALLKEDPQLSGVHIKNFISSFIKRCRVSFKDPCIRVGRDPLRKLHRDERIISTIIIAHKHGIPTTSLEFGAAAGIIYAILLVDPNDKECQIIKKVYDKNKSVRDVLTYTGEYNGKPYCLLNENDLELIKRIENHFVEIVKTLNINI